MTNQSVTGRGEDDGDGRSPARPSSRRGECLSYLLPIVLLPPEIVVRHGAMSDWVS